MKAQLPENSIQKYKYIYHFLPHKHYKTRARLLSHGALISYSFVLLCAVFMFKVVPIVSPGVLGYASNINISDLLIRTNEQRAQVGLSPLRLNNTLSVAAQRKAQDMFKVGYWAHESPIGTTPWDFILGEGYDYLYAGENLAKNFSNSKDVVQAWYESPTHRDNLLSANYDEIGFAVVNGVLDGYETTLVVQMFGKARVPVQLASATPPDDLRGSSNSLANEVASSGIVNEVLVEEVMNDSVAPIAREIELKNSDISQPLVDVRAVSRALILVFGGFAFLLLTADMWYSKRHGILKLTGHTLAHLVFLIVSIISVMISVLPGAIL
ncbi:CAP domain-containing protein [Patescibacteria group bacterium]